MQTAAAVAAPQEKKGAPILMPDRFGVAEFKRTDHVADLPLSVTLEQAMEPSYWAHVAADMSPGDHIELRAEDGAWHAYLIVAYCERNYAKVVLDRVVKMLVDTSIPISSQKHRVDWKGNLHKHSVIRLSDSEIIKDGFRTKEEAAIWMAEHEKTVGR